MKKNFFAITLSLALLTLSTTLSFADVDQVTITHVQGDAHILRGGQSISIKDGDTCQKEDVLVTGDDGTLDISVNNLAGSRILPGSEISVADTQKEDMRLKIQKGNVILNLDKLPKKSTFKVETPTAVAVARGTQFWGRVQALKANSPTTSFAVREGVIDVMSITTGQTISLREGQALDIPRDLIGNLNPRQALGQEISTMEQASSIRTCS